MSRKFVDSSGLVKLYVPEPDSAAVQAELASASELLISALALLEVPSALYGKVRQGAISASDAAVAIAAFDAGVHLFRILPVKEDVMLRARTLLDLHAVPDRLRPPDAIQIAAALLENQASALDAFVSTDHDQRAVASYHGLTLFP